MATWQEYKATMDMPSTLWSAAKTDDAAELARLLAAGADIDARDHRGYSALMLAAYSGSAAAFGLLLDRGADPNSADLSGNSVLMGAAFKGHEEFVIRLLAAGADAAAKNQMSLDAREFAAQFGRTAIVALFDSLIAHRSVA